MKKALLLTHNDLELDCVILSEKTFPLGGEEVLCYAQNRIVKGFMKNDIVAELEIVVNFCIIPELAEELYEIPSTQIF